MGARVRHGGTALPGRDLLGDTDSALTLGRAR